MTISEEKMRIVINNYFKTECDVNTSIRQAFEKGFRIGVKKGLSAQPFTEEQIQTMQELEDAQLEKAYELGKADKPKWIPVSERLPEEGDVVLICSKIGAIDFGKRKSDKWVWLAEALWDYWQETEDLIAWMPLPEAYKESDTDGSN